MRARAPTKRETWEDWVSGETTKPTRLLSRDELIAEIRTWGTDVTVSDIRFWEYEGILPRAVKRWHEGANRVFYPLWMAALIMTLRALQDAGMSLRNIAPILREKAQDFAEISNTYESIEASNPGVLHRSFLLVPATELFADALLNQELVQHAHRVGRMLGQPVEHMRLELRGADGKVIEGATYLLNVPADPRSSDSDAT